MVTRSADQATDCRHESTDWTTIGSRILEAALIASAIHTRECAGQAGKAPQDAGEPAMDCELAYWPAGGRSHTDVAGHSRS